MWPFARRKSNEIRADTWAEIDTSTTEGQLLYAALVGNSTLTVDEAMQIPAVAACVRLIADTVSMVPFKLYKVDQDEIQLEEVPDDPRVQLVNKDPKDTLDATQLKKAIVRDYLLDKGGYVYVDKVGNKVRSLRYVEPGRVSFNWNADPIFKDYDILVNGGTYKPYQFLKILRHVRYIVYDGFVKSPKHLTDIAIKALKDAWARLFSTNSENVVVLNDGLEFQEASESSTEMQINENISTLTKQICEIFGVPVQLLNREVGSASEEDRIVFIQYCIQPILTAIENALNRVLLLESEKTAYKWAADITEFTKADVLKRYQAYELACKNGFMQIDEVRYRENMAPLGLDFVKLGLQDVLYYPEKNGMTFVPNMNAVGGIELAMEDRETARKQKEAEIEAMKASSETPPEQDVPDDIKENPEGGEEDADRGQE